MIEGQMIEKLQAIVGPDYCLTEALALEPHLLEERGLFRGSALCAVKPASTGELAQVMKFCWDNNIPMVPQGGNTGLCGGGVPSGQSVVILTERLNRIRQLDVLNRSITVEAGCILAHVQQAADQANLLFPLSLGAEGSCRIGGNLSTNAGGLNVIHYGNARDLTLGLEVVLPDGQIWNNLKGLRKDNSGYDLKHLFIGAEGTLGIITAAVLRLYSKPNSSQTAFIAVRDPGAALNILSLAQTKSGDSVTGCELIPRVALDFWLTHQPNAHDPIKGHYPWYLLLELESSLTHGLDAVMEDILSASLECGWADDAVVAVSETQRRNLWRIREEIPIAQKRAGASIKNDISVLNSAIPTLIERASRAVEQVIPGIRVVAFGHLGDGSIHFNLSEPVGCDSREFLAQWDVMARIVHDIVEDLGGSFAAEHGIGQLKVDEMVRIKPSLDIDLMQKIKAAIDPKSLMNPGKIVR
jgi:FAD/FMN-containing dehydrogenase